MGKEKERKMGSFFRLQNRIPWFVAGCMYLFCVLRSLQPVMLNEAKTTRPRPRPRPELWGQGRSQFLEVEAKA